ncbi:MAG: hypothetical protein QOK25_2063, partial [Thermoleophilaceae bacterium]|nr:hypothetical protein [Thermoleophilaceae bacterium]
VTGGLASCGGSSHKAGVQGHSEVAAQPVSTAGANPFTPAVGKDATGIKPPRAAVSSGGGPATYSGGLPGLYGGTRNYTTCDAHKLITFLEGNPAKAGAWASTLGIQTSEIRRYVNKLTAVTLRTDTRVTNHGYVGGRADAIQAVLQAGTAVFVNQYGRPVVKCYCGNPLTPPVLYREPAYVGPLWSGFAPSHITIINQTTTIIDTFTLFDPGTGMTFPQGAGLGGKSGPYTGTGTSKSPANPPPGQTPQQAPPSTGPSATENPSASFSPNPGKVGDTFTIAASGFSPGANLQVTLTRPDGVVEHYGISIGSDGTGAYTFTNTGNAVTGTYNATVTNPATGAQTQASVQVLP